MLCPFRGKFAVSAHATAVLIDPNSGALRTAQKGKAGGKRPHCMSNGAVAP